MDHIQNDILNVHLNNWVAENRLKSIGKYYQAFFELHLAPFSGVWYSRYGTSLVAPSLQVRLVLDLGTDLLRTRLPDYPSRHKP